MKHLALAPLLAVGAISASCAAPPPTEVAAPVAVARAKAAVRLASATRPLARASVPYNEPADGGTSILPRRPMAYKYFRGDAAWYVANIPFFECSDPQISQIYYYRWQLYKAHLKDLGERGYIVTEFLDDVSWSLKPYESLNDATGFHIHEGRWLRDPRYIDDYIRFMNTGGNDRHFSEAIADASYNRYLVNGDRAFILAQLDAMKRVYGQWEDHYDKAKGLYYIEPLLDATEYTISSIDASGGKDGFGGGDAFRPSINSFMFANARAISQLATMAGDQATSRDYAAKSQALRQGVQASLWNAEMGHFIDRYKVNNQYVKYWDFIRGRELAGFTPWYFELPDRDPKYVSAWQHLLAPDKLGGTYGIRTVEPSYQYYMKQYRYDRVNGVNQPECQWNGPTWPFQTTLALGGMANLLHDYPAQTVVTRDDYVRLLKQYTAQHYVDGQPDLQEDLNPDTGKVIVGLERSHHYNHSGYNDLVITGLVGLHPRADNTLEVDPLLPTNPRSPQAINYLCLENVAYHGHIVTVLYDRDGKRYNRGAGLAVYVDGKQVVKPSPLGKKTVALPALKTPIQSAPLAPLNLAVNLARKGLPAPSSSMGGDARDLYRAVDGRVWFYPNVKNYWSNEGSAHAQDWFAVDFGSPQNVSQVKLYFYEDSKTFRAPTAIELQAWVNNGWQPISLPNGSRTVANGETVLDFKPLNTSQVRVLVPNAADVAELPQRSVALVEMKVYGAQKVNPRPAIDPARTGGLPAQLDNLQSENSHEGTFNGARWRDASEGGYFAFDLPIVPNAPYDLVVTYWGGDANNRQFDVLVNGEKVGTQVLENNKPGQFFEVTYPIPAQLMAGKTKVTVRFQAHPGAFAGGVFGARLVF